MNKNFLVSAFLCATCSSFAQTTNVFNSSGNAAVGTTAPVHPFEVVGGASGRIVFSGTTNDANANSPKFCLWGLGGQATVTGPSLQAISSGVWGGHRLGIFQHATADADYATETEVVSITDNGFVGLGTTSPQRRLDVQGSSGEGIRISNSSYTGYYTDLVTNLNDVTTFQIKVQGASVFQAGGTDNTVISSLGTNKDIILTPNGSGKVGIGTTSPTEKLSVDGNVTISGNIVAKKLKVLPSPWADYVFADNYKLRSLLSLETFIKQNKRLPDVPSSKEVQKEGINVGDNQALLLKKIEELTLYVIELKKESTAQQKQIDNQSKEIIKLKNKK